MTELKPTEAAYNPENGFIETYTGKRFFPETPTFVPGDIAHALGMLCRYNGHCSRFYSVAEHSVMVSRMMRDMDLGNPLEGLLHDASEAYMTDVPAPFKRLLPDWQAFDARVELAMRAHFGLAPKKSEGCKRADWLALFVEEYFLLPSHGEIFADPFGLRAEALTMLDSYKPQCLAPADASEQFRQFYRGLYGQV